MPLWLVVELSNRNLETNEDRNGKKHRIIEPQWKARDISSYNRGPLSSSFHSFLDNLESVPVLACYLTVVKTNESGEFYESRSTPCQTKQRAEKKGAKPEEVRTRDCLCTSSGWLTSMRGLDP